MLLASLGQAVHKQVACCGNVGFGWNLTAVMHTCLQPLPLTCLRVALRLAQYAEGVSGLLQLSRFDLKERKVRLALSLLCRHHTGFIDLIDATFSRLACKGQPQEICGAQACAK